MTNEFSKALLVNRFEASPENQHNLRTPQISEDMDPQKMNYQAGQAQGQAQEKTNNLMDMAGNAAQSAKETAQQAGQTVMASAQGAADAVKNATGMNKN
ncbi:hypothetical protein GmHk_18G053396 [Glycine max]|nr:hypothetical protein GmHk_18G053396 [Glycine max]